MRTYIITKTSDWGYSEEKPVPEAREADIHPFAIMRRDSPRRVLYRDFIDLEGDNVRGTQINTTKAWVADIEDIADFIKKYGKCVVFNSYCEEGYMEIEIYDTYRE